MRKTQSKFWVVLNRINKVKAGYLFILPQFILFFGLMVYPILSGFKLSMYKITLKDKVFIGFDNYIKLFNDKVFIKAVTNTILLVITIVILSVVFGIIVSAAVFEKSNRYISFIRGCYYIPVVVSMVVMSVVWKFLFTPASGLINYILGLFGIEPVNFLGDPNLVMPIIIFVTFVSLIGTVIILYIAAMIGIPKELFESAEIDGASKIQQLLFINLPSIKPTTLFIVINQTITVMKLFVVIQLMTNGGPNHSSVTLMFLLYEKAFLNIGRLGEAAAIGVIIFIICFILSVMQFFVFDDKPKFWRKKYEKI
jgi:multiple sugar transport system permease protein